METENNRIQYNYYSIECLNIRYIKNYDMKYPIINSSYQGKIN